MARLMREGKAKWRDAALDDMGEGIYVYAFNFVRMRCKYASEARTKKILEVRQLPDFQTFLRSCCGQTCITQMQSSWL